MLTAIRAQTKATKTSDQLNDVLVDVVDQTMAGRPISVGGKFEAALRSQERIGWRAMLHGYWSKEWQIAYQDTYQPPPTETVKDRKKRIIAMALWQKRLLQTVFQRMICLWRLRNNERHGRDSETRESARREVLNNKIQVIYEERDR
jgi:hypothetical protein